MIIQYKQLVQDVIIDNPAYTLKSIAKQIQAVPCFSGKIVVKAPFKCVKLTGSKEMSCEQIHEILSRVTSVDIADGIKPAIYSNGRNFTYYCDNVHQYSGNITTTDLCCGNVNSTNIDWTQHSITGDSITAILKMGWRQAASVENAILRGIKITRRDKIKQDYPEIRSSLPPSVVNNIKQDGKFLLDVDHLTVRRVTHPCYKIDFQTIRFTDDCFWGRLEGVGILDCSDAAIVLSALIEQGCSIKVDGLFNVGNCNILRSLCPIAKTVPVYTATIALSEIHWDSLLEHCNLAHFNEEEFVRTLYQIYHQFNIEITHPLKSRNLCNLDFCAKFFENPNISKEDVLAIEQRWFKIIKSEKKKVNSFN